MASFVPLAHQALRRSLERIELHGSRPRFDAAMWRMLRTGVVPDDLGFTFTPRALLGYSGIARKQAAG